MMDSEIPSSDECYTVCAECIGKDFADKYKNNLAAFRAFTWAPNPNRYRSLDPTQQYKALLACVLLKRPIKDTFNVFLFTPELTETGNIHIHGYYSIKDSIKYYNWFLPAVKSFGFVTVKSIVNETWTHDYVCKDMTKMEDILDHDVPIPLTNDNYDSYRFHRDYWTKAKNVHRVTKDILYYINKK